MRRWLVILCTLSIGIAACGGDSDEEGDAGGPASEESDRGAMEALLALVPAEPGASDLVIVNDYGSAAEVAGIERPEPGADEQSILDWFLPLSIGRDGQPGLGLQLHSFFGNQLTEDTAWRDEIGWAPIDVTRAVEVFTDEFGTLYAFDGEFHPDTIDDAVHDDPAWSDQLEIEEHAGVEFYSWGEDDDLTPNITVVRDLGFGGRMAVLDDNTILWGLATEQVEAGIEAATGEADSLADDDEIGPLARAMDDESALAAIFSADGAAFAGVAELDALADGFGDDLDADDLADLPTLAPYTALATGVRSTEDGPKLILALLHDDAGAAEENIGRLEVVVDEGTSNSSGAWADLVSLESAETDGELLVATLAINDPSEAGLWRSIVLGRDTLIATS